MCAQERPHGAGEKLKGLNMGADLGEVGRGWRKDGPYGSLCVRAKQQNAHGGVSTVRAENRVRGKHPGVGNQEGEDHRSKPMYFSRMSRGTRPPCSSPIFRKP